MQNLFQSIRKKRNLRRLSVVWIFLLVIELFCPVFGDEESVLAADFNVSQYEAVSIIKVKDKTPDASLTAADHDHQSHDQVVCHDECLCHATAIPSINIITLKESVTVHDQIAFRYGNPVFNSLPPPFQPPKNS